MHIDCLTGAGDARHYRVRLGSELYDLLLTPRSRCILSCDHTGKREPVAQDLSDLLIDMLGLEPAPDERSESFRLDILRAYGRIACTEGDKDSCSALSKEGIREIKAAFREWRGVPTKAQKNVLTRYGLGFVGSKGCHGRIYRTDDPTVRITVVSTPSDHMTGRVVATKILNDLLYKRS